MFARELASCINYAGMERCARKIVLKDKLATAEEVSLMTDLEVYEKILEKYEVVMCEAERVLLVDQGKMDEFNDIAVYLSR